MKILHIIDSGGLYGAENVLLNLVYEQLKLGIQPVIASIGIPGMTEKPLEIEARNRNLPIKKFRFRAGFNVKGALRILNYAKIENFQLLHSHGYKGNILFGFMPRIIRGMPIVSTLHGWTSTTGFTKMRVYEWLDAMSLRRMDRVILVNSTISKHQCLRVIPEHKKVVIHNGITFSENHEVTLSKSIRNFIYQRFTVVAVGRFSPEKNFSSLIQASAELIKDGLDIQLLLLGDGRLRKNYVEQINNFDITDRVLMPGYVNNVFETLKHCQLFAMPSLTEGMPIALLEAMAAEIPILAARVGGIPDALLNGHAGLLFCPRELSELKDAIRQLYFGPSIARSLVHHAKNRVRNEFSSQKMAEKYLQLYSAEIYR